MQVLILATDEQPKLGPLTATMPAALLPLVDRPVIATTLEILGRCGCPDVLISLYERGGQIAAYVGGGRRWGFDIKYVTQREAWGSAGSLRWAGSLLETTTLVLPGDALFDLDLAEALAFHHAHGGKVTAILHAPRPGDRHPGVRINDNQRITELGAAAGDLQVTGAIILEPELLQTIPDHEHYDIVADLLPELLAANEPVYGFRMSGYWNPLTTFGDYHEAQQVYLYSAYAASTPEEVIAGPTERIRYPSLEARQIAPGIWVGREYSIHPTVKLAPPVYIGQHSWIGREVELGFGTIIGSNVVIDDEATIIQSSILNNTYVGQLVHIEHKLVTPGSVNDPVEEVTSEIVDPFLIGQVENKQRNRSSLRRTLTNLVALALILLTSPLLGVIGLLNFLTTGGRMLVRDVKVGQRLNEENERLYTFELIHFRTRNHNGGYTLLGKWLEQWELHRLPEFFNVLRGDLELVGVKPLSCAEAAQLTEEWHQRRHDAPAGLTGLWYLQTESTTDLDTVIVTDVYYTATRSWLEDVRILLQTPSVWARRIRTHPPRHRDEKTKNQISRM